MEMTTSPFVRDFKSQGKTSIYLAYLDSKHVFNSLDDYQLLVTMGALAILNIVIAIDNQ
jgi:hypothetical protein